MTTKIRMTLLILCASLGLTHGQITDSVYMENGKRVQLIYAHDDPDKISPLRIVLYPYGRTVVGRATNAGPMIEAEFDTDEIITIKARATFPYSPVENTPRPDVDPYEEVSLFEYSLMGTYKLFSFSGKQQAKVDVYKTGPNYSVKYYGNFYMPYQHKGHFGAMGGVSYLRSPGSTGVVNNDTLSSTPYLDFVMLNVGFGLSWGFNVKLTGVRNEELTVEKSLMKKMRANAYINLGYAVAQMSNHYWFNETNGEYFERPSDDLPMDVSRLGVRLGVQGNYYLTESFKISVLGEVGVNPGYKGTVADNKNMANRIFVGVGYDL